MFETLTGRLNQIFDNLRKRGKLSEADVDAAMKEVRLALLEADVHFSVVKSFIAKVRERAVGAEVSKALNPGQQIIKIVNEGTPTLLYAKDRAGRMTMANRAMLAAFITVASVNVAAETPTRADKRQDRQTQRIEQGKASGELTDKEAARLDKGQAHVQAKEDAAKADGVVTKKEKVGIEKAQDRQNRRIVKQKNDKQDKN